MKDLPIFVWAFLEGFTPGFLGKTRRPAAPEFLFAQDSSEPPEDPSEAEDPKEVLDCGELELPKE